MFDYIQALGESDLNLIAWLCSKLEPRGFFLIHRHALSQVILLSLLQQLGFDLSRDTILKLTWLTEIATVLNPKDDTIHAHVTGILEALHGNLSHLTSQLSHSSSESAQVASMCRVLTLIVQSLLDPLAPLARVMSGGGGGSGVGSLTHSYSSIPSTPSPQPQPNAAVMTPPPGFAHMQYRY